MDPPHGHIENIESNTILSSLSFIGENTTKYYANDSGN